MDLGLHGHPLRVWGREEQAAGAAWQATKRSSMRCPQSRPEAPCAAPSNGHIAPASLACPDVCLCFQHGQEAICEAYKAAPRRPELQRDEVGSSAEDGGGGASGRRKAAGGGRAALEPDGPGPVVEDGATTGEEWAGYDPACYMMANECEYWAEGSQAWFNATVREGECCRMGAPPRSCWPRHQQGLRVSVWEQCRMRTGAADWLIWMGHPSAQRPRLPTCVLPPTGHGAHHTKTAMPLS